MIDSKFPAEIITDAQDAHAAFYPRGPFVCISLAQWALESAFGTAEPPGSDNDFGIKAVAGQDYVVTMTHETLHGKYVQVPQHFAKYKTHREGFMAHAKLLATSPLYHAAQEATTPEAYAMALQGIYATGIPGHPYGEAVISLINAFDLKQYDVQPKAQAAPSPPAEQIAAIKKPELPILKQLLVLMLQAIVQTLENQKNELHSLIAAPPSELSLLGESPAMTDNAPALAALDADGFVRPAAPAAPVPAAPAAPAPAPTPAAAPTVSAAVAIDWGDFADQLLTHAEPIVESVAPGLVSEALTMVPAGSLISAFITPKVVAQYVDVGMKTLEGVFAGRALTFEHSGAIETFVINSFNNFEPKLAAFLGDKLSPIVKAEVAKVLHASPVSRAA